MIYLHSAREFIVVQRDVMSNGITGDSPTPLPTTILVVASREIGCDKAQIFNKINLRRVLWRLHVHNRIEPKRKPRAAIPRALDIHFNSGDLVQIDGGA
jgi:hypothetical protein